MICRETEEYKSDERENRERDNSEGDNSEGESEGCENNERENRKDENSESENEDHDDSERQSEEGIVQSNSRGKEDRVGNLVGQSGGHQGTSIASINSTNSGRTGTMAGIDDLVDKLTQNLTHVQTDDFTKAQVEMGFGGTLVSKLPGVDMPLAQDIDEYLQRVEAAMTGKWSDAGKIALAKKYCFAQARTAAQLCEPGANGDYKVFKEALRKKFPYLVTHDEILERLSQAKRKTGQTLEAFMLELQGWMEKANKKDPSRSNDAKSNLVRTFLRTMPRRYITRVTDELRKDPDKLLADEIEYVSHRPDLKLSNEYILQNEKGQPENKREVMAVNERRNPGGKYWCVYHKRDAGHSSADCKLGKSLRSGSKGPGTYTPNPPGPSPPRPQSHGPTEFPLQGRGPQLSGPRYPYSQPSRTPGYGATYGPPQGRHPFPPGRAGRGGSNSTYQGPGGRGNGNPNRGYSPMGPQGGGNSHRGNQGGQPQMRCYQCRGYGHMARNCPTRQSDMGRHKPQGGM